jgi:hypothetical protein
MKNKPMSDGEVNDKVGEMLGDDLDGIEAHGLFDEEKQPNQTEGVKVEAHGVSVHIKPMNGEQTKDMPAVRTANSAEDDDNPEFGL